MVVWALCVLAATSKGPAGIAGPERLVLGRDVSADITVTKPDVKLVVNVGLLSPLRAGKAVYQPPTDKFPQVLLIAALDETDTLVDWLAVPLYGQGVVETKTEPLAEVTALVADEKFGPVLADAKGKVRIPILAPPGVASATAVARDKLGNQRQSEIDLNVPPFNRALAICPRSAERLTIIAVEPTGTPATVLRLKTQASRGTLAPARNIAPGVFDAVLTLPEATQVGDEVTLSVGSSRCALTVEGFTPARLSVVLDQPSFTAGSGTTINATLTVTDAVGRPALAAVTAAADMGRVDTPRLLAPGVYGVRWRPADHFNGKRFAYLSVQAGGLSVEQRLQLVPARGHDLTLHMPPVALEADGRSQAELELRVVDRFGNSVPDAKPHVRAQGQLSTPSWQDDAFHARYTAPFSYAAHDDVAVAKDDASQTEGRLRIPLVPKQRLWLFGPQVGFTTNFVRLYGPYLGGDLALRLPGVFNRFTLGLDFGVTFASWQVAQTSASVWVLPLLARVRYSLPFGRWELQPSVGLGASIIGARTTSGEGGTVSTLAASFAVAPSLGLAYWIGPGQIALSVGYWYTRSNGVVAGNLGGLLAAVGYRFGL